MSVDEFYKQFFVVFADEKKKKRVNPQNQGYLNTLKCVVTGAKKKRMKHETNSCTAREKTALHLPLLN